MTANKQLTWSLAITCGDIPFNSWSGTVARKPVNGYNSDRRPSLACSVILSVAPREKDMRFGLASFTAIHRILRNLGIRQKSISSTPTP